MHDNSNTRATAARAFVRSLNILLKFARMYDFGHPRTAKQYETAWTELRTALGQDDEAGLLLAVSGDSLLLDGTPLDSAAAEKSFAHMLGAAGIASIHFSPKVTHASLARFVRGFPTGSGSKPTQLAEQLKAALQGDPNIHVNEVCFVPADSAVAKTTMAAQLAARTLGMNSEQTDQLLNDPEKLLQLIVAAEGTRGGGAGPGDGPGLGPGLGPGNGPGTGGASGGPSGSVSGTSVGAGSTGSAEPGGVLGLYRGRWGTGPGSPMGNAGADGRPGGGSGASGGYSIDGSQAGPGGNENSGKTGNGNYGGASGNGGNAVGGWAGFNNGPALEGPATSVQGSGAPSGGNGSGSWNIVGGSGGGAVLDPNVGGFWLNDPSGQQTGSAGGGSVNAISGQPSGGLNGPVSGVGRPGGGSSSNGSSDASSAKFGGSWNIVGGSEGGTPIDPNAGGFWLKDAPGGQPSVTGSVSGVSNASAGSGYSGSNPAAWSGGSGSGSGTGTSGTGGSAGPESVPGVGSTGSAARSVQGNYASGFGGGPGVAVDGSTAAPGLGGTGGGNSPAPAANGETGTQAWRPAGGGGGDFGPGAVSRWTNASSGIRASRTARGGQGSMAVETGLMTLQEDELQGILQVLAQIARTNDASKDKLDPSSFQSRLSTLPRRARFTVSQALSALAAQAPAESSDKPTLLKLAEHIAIRFALESYEKGDVQVNSVRTMLNDMSAELDGLRKILGVYEEKMARAGVHVQSHMEMLAQEFWSQVPDEKKKTVLESGDAWCVPPVRLREYVEKLKARGETAAVENILKNYASCIRNKETEARRQTAMGLAELASLYSKCDEKLFVETIREVGVQLAEEKVSELQSLVGAAFVRLSQEASKLRSFPALQRSIEMLDYLESERPGFGKSLRPRIAVENRLPEFIEDSLKAGSVPAGLTDLLRRMPQPAAELIAGRFGRVGFREDCELLVSMMEALGPEGLDHLRAQLRTGHPSDAIDAIGILARMDLETVERVLPDRMKQWKRTAHDRVVRQIASSGSPDRGRLLLQLFDLIDTLIRPLAIDEIGMAGEKSADMRLLRIAEGDLPRGSTEYLRLKAIEALGRLRTAGAEAILRKVAEARKTWRWANPSELRVVAAQAMEKIDAEWMRSFIPRSGLNLAEFSIELLDSDPNSSAIRQRRYPRLKLENPVSATTTNLKENHRLDIPEMGLGGGVAVCEQSMHPGNLIELRLTAGQKQVKAQTIVRDANTQARTFEVVDMELEERAKLRKLLVQLGSTQKQSTPQERSRRGTRTILSTGS
jgi:hypothetical protein